MDLGVDYGPGSVVRTDIKRLACSHRFHEGCIEEWNKQSPYCPVCKSHEGVLQGEPQVATQAQQKPQLPFYKHPLVLLSALYLIMGISLYLRNTEPLCSLVPAAQPKLPKFRRTTCTILSVNYTTADSYGVAPDAVDTYGRSANEDDVTRPPAFLLNGGRRLASPRFCLDFANYAIVAGNRTQTSRIYIERSPIGTRRISPAMVIQKQKCPIPETGGIGVGQTKICWVTDSDSKPVPRPEFRGKKVYTCACQVGEPKADGQDASKNCANSIEECMTFVKPSVQLKKAKDACFYHWTFALVYLCVGGAFAVVYCLVRSCGFVARGSCWFMQADAMRPPCYVITAMIFLFFLIVMVSSSENGAV